MSEHNHARELAHKMICNVLERTHEATGIVDYAFEASAILDDIEARCVGRVRGELIFSDPAETATFLEGGPFA